jgi:hypothetical protein
VQLNTCISELTLLFIKCVWCTDRTGRYEQHVVIKTVVIGEDVESRFVYFDAGMSTKEVHGHGTK